MFRSQPQVNQQTVTTNKICISKTRNLCFFIYIFLAKHKNFQLFVLLSSMWASLMFMFKQQLRQKKLQSYANPNLSSRHSYNTWGKLDFQNDDHGLWYELQTKCKVQIKKSFIMIMEIKEIMRPLPTTRADIYYFLLVNPHHCFLLIRCVV